MAAKAKLREKPAASGALVASEPALALKVDFGCGPRPREGFIGCDRIAFPGVAHVLDLGSARYPFADGSVAEAHTSHFIEHLTAVERVHFCNELYRVLAPDAKCSIIVPHWNNVRAYGDLTHQWPPMSEFWFYYLDKNWRMQNAPHNDAQHWDKGYSCDFLCTWGYSLDGDVSLRSADYQQFAMRAYTNSIVDIHATMTKRA